MSMHMGEERRMMQIHRRRTSAAAPSDADGLK
jgi:hypothetical protein